MARESNRMDPPQQSDRNDRNTEIDEQVLGRADEMSWDDEEEFEDGDDSDEEEDEGEENS